MAVRHLVAIFADGVNCQYIVDDGKDIDTVYNPERGGNVLKSIKSSWYHDEGIMNLSTEIAPGQL